MKKIISVIMALSVFISTCAFSASAETVNRCGEISSFLSVLFLQGFANPENSNAVNGISVSKTVEYSANKDFNKSQYYDGGNESVLVIPVKDLKTAVDKYFEGITTNAKYTQEIERMEIVKKDGVDCVKYGVGGYGDSYHFELNCYKDSGNSVYTVYGYGADILEDGIQPGMVEGKDYIYGYTKDSSGKYVKSKYPCQISNTYEIKVRNKGGYYQFISAKYINSIPSDSSLIYFTTEIKKNEPATASTKQSSSTQKSATKSTKSTKTASAANSSTASSVTSSQSADNFTTEISDETGITGIDSSAFEDGTVVKAVLITDEIKTKEIAEKLTDIAKSGKIFAIDLSAAKDNVTVQPDGSVAVTVKIPDGFNKENVAVYYIPEDDSAPVRLEATVNEDGTVTFTTDHFSVYALVEESGTADSENSDSAEAEEQSKSGSVIFIVIAAVIVAAAAAVAIVLIAKKKKA